MNPLHQTLNAAVAGDRESATQLVELLYEELRRLARARLRGAPCGETLQTTALVHEAYLRLIEGGDPGWDGRAHFFGAAARAMRNVLVDQARRKAAARRSGSGPPRQLELDGCSFDPPLADMLALDEALVRFEAQEPRRAQVVMLRYFAGLTEPETAEVMKVSESTVVRDWRFARAWLYDELQSE